MQDFVLQNSDLKNDVQRALSKAAQPLNADDPESQKALRSLLRGLLIEEIDPSVRSVNDRLLNSAYDNWKALREALRPTAEKLLTHYEDQTGHRPRTGPPGACESHRPAETILDGIETILKEALAGSIEGEHSEPVEDQA